MDKQAQGASFGGSFLVPEIDMIFGTELPPLFEALIANSVLV